MEAERRLRSEQVEILIAEDSPTQAEQLRHILEQHDYRVSVAGNGQEALALINKNRPMIVITDIIMPQMDGYQLCKKIKSDENLKEIAVILLTSLSDPKDVVKGLECGADNFITKPYEERYLLSRIQYLLANWGLRHDEKIQVGVEIFFAGQRYFITSDRLQILNLLLSTYETAIQKNLELKKIEDELRRLNEQLEVSNRELEAFSYSVSHDLRAPLRGIDGFSQALLEEYTDRLNDQGKDYLHRISAASKRMGQLIDDLLGLSRVTRSEMHREKVDMSALVQSIAAEIKRAQPERKAEFIIADGIVTDGDARLLRIALENLLGNAWKFTSKRPYATIEFGVTQHGGKSDYFVRDNGAGFDMAYADKLFSAFQRLHSPAEFPGTGIGLAIVQRIIHRHQGHIWAEGAIDKGATFYFTL